jgi:hypothetical protein
MQPRLFQLPVADVGFRFPRMSGANLEGRAFQLPADLDGWAQLIVLPFERWQQSLVDTWMPTVRRLQREHRGLEAYEMPILEAVNPFSRNFIESTLRTVTTDVGSREHTIVLYTDKAAFRAQLGIADETTIQLFLVDVSGRICWRSEGARTDRSAAALTDAVTRLVPRAH